MDWMMKGVGEMTKEPDFIPIKEPIKPPVERTAEGNIIEAYALLIRDVEKHHRELIDEIAAMRELRTIIEKEREEIHIIRRMLSQILYTARNSDPTTLFPSDPSITLPFAAEPDLAPFTTDPARSEQVRAGQEKGHGRSEQVRAGQEKGQGRSNQLTPSQDPAPTSDSLTPSPNPAQPTSDTFTQLTTPAYNSEDLSTLPNSQ